MTRKTASLAVGLAIVSCSIFFASGFARSAIAQADRAAFDRARAEQLRRAQPTYMHSPVFAEFDGVVVNLHAITAYHDDPAGSGFVMIQPSATIVPVTYDVFHATVLWHARHGVWRPDWSPPLEEP